ncbi:unnamed protein product [Rotaria sp. Silwood2]|nr:unnamed protein product [Rotaria sp. Silwood2]
MFVFGPKDSYKLFETDSLLDNQSASTQTTDNRSFLIDEKHFTIDICSNFNESNQVNYESIRRFQTDRLTLFLFIIEGNTDGKIDPESIITFKILSDIYLFDTKSYLFIVNGSYPIQDQNTMKSNIELLLDLEDIQVSFINSKSLDYFEVLIQTLRKCKPSIPSKQKEFSWTYPKIKELKDQLEQKPNCLSEIYYLHSLLKEANVKTEDNDGLLVFSYRNIQYFYDYKKNKLSCSNNQGIKLLDKKGFGMLKYLLKRDALFRQSKQIQNEFDQGILDKAITDFLKQINEHTLKTNDDETRRQMDAIDRMIFALQDESNQNMNETKKQLERELHNYEQHQSNLRNFENDIRKTKKRIQNLSIKVADGDNSEVMLESDDRLNDFLQIERFDRNREQKDFDVLTKHLCDENEALNKLKNELENKQNVQTTLENRNAEIEALKFAKSQYEGPIETLKKEKEALEKEKLEKIREKRTQDIFKDVGGSDRTVRHNNKYYRPHEECTEFPKNNYTCQYIEAVQEAVHFVSEKLEIEKSIDIEATKLELLKKLSEER